MDECKQRLPLPALMSKLGFGSEFQKASCRSPFREDKNPSFGIFQHEGRWFWKDHGTNESGDEVTFIEKALGISNRDALSKFEELAGVDKKQANGKFKVADMEHPWNECVRRVTQKDIKELASWRGYRLEFCDWLKQRRLIGLKDGLLSMPISMGEINAGRWQFELVTGIHQRRKDGSWRIYGGAIEPLVIEGSSKPARQFVFESQWDAFAFLDVMGDQPDARLIITRGAGNGALVAPFNLSLPTTIIMQNDEVKSGRAPAESWALKVEATLDKTPCKKLYPPKEHKDLNDWLIALTDFYGKEKSDCSKLIAEWLNRQEESQKKKTTRSIGTLHCLGTHKRIPMLCLATGGYAKVVPVCGLAGVELESQCYPSRQRLPGQSKPRFSGSNRGRR